MSLPFPEPSRELADPRALFVRYLDYFRSVLAAKLTGLSRSQFETSMVASGWTPIELLVHLVHVERRWLQWGFLGEQVDDPWGDQEADGRWSAPADVSVEEWLACLAEVGLRTTQIIEANDLDALAAVGGRFQTEAERPTLAWILFHVLQEYARHVGHLDIVRELMDGEVGE